MRSTDPSTLTPSERLAEICDILARGVQRLFAQEGKPPTVPRNSKVRLDDLAAVEAPCGSQVQSPKSRKST